MKRSAVFAVAIVLTLVGGRLLVSHGIRPVAAARYSTAVASSPSANMQPASDAVTSNENSNSEPFAGETGAGEAHNATPQPAIALADGGVTDIDPHKAFGSKSAPIVMEVFSDYQCPACKNLFLTTNRQLMDNYVSTGKVYLIHRDFPLQMHAYSRVAARYARASADIGKIEPVERALFENQDKWEQTGDVDGAVGAVLSPAEMNKVRALVKGGTLEPLIDKDYAIGMGYRVSQTPTTVFHSNGQTYPYSGAMNYEILRKFLDQLLSQK